MVESFTQSYDSDFMVEEFESLFSTANLDIEPPKVVLDVIRQYAYLLSDEHLIGSNDAFMLN